MSVDTVAAGILKRGVALDQQKRYTEALVCYQEGLQILIDKIKDENDADLKNYLRKKIEDYMNRGEQIKKLIAEQKNAGNFHEQIHIDDNSTGHSYKSLFGRFLDEDVSGIRIEDPYVRSFHQCQNLLRLCELLVQTCKNLKIVYLITSSEDNKSEQAKWFDLLRNSLSSYGIKLIVEYSLTLHDRQILLSTGWIVKIGRGLDIYKPPENKFTIGVYELDLRRCHNTTVDIFHSKDVKHTFS